VPADAILSRNAASPDQVRELQQSLRALGYHRSSITGVWGAGTDAAVAALRYDLLHNDGSDSEDPQAAAPVPMTSFNADGGVVAAPASGVSSVEPALAACIDALMADGRVGKVPAAADAARANAQVWSTVVAMRSAIAPTPFLLAIFKQESGGRHYQVPVPGDLDNFVIVGQDRNDPAAPQAITSRGYGLGQYTFFHHPLGPAEISGLVDDPTQNALAAFKELRGKFKGAVVTGDKATSADDRLAEHPLLSLRECIYPTPDARRFIDCQACAAKARKVDIKPGDPVFEGSKLAWAPTQYYASASYVGVPDRADFPCDWPYAVRRYNGSGINSYHYQARVLTNVLHLG
jgi:peptidoglycan hydrolase-like protein with peptidoglycan-binding domain